MPNGVNAWHNQAACRLTEGDLFFAPEREGPRARERRVNKAKEMCASCPVRPNCRTHALEAPESYGIWGGLGEDDRTVFI